MMCDSVFVWLVFCICVEITFIFVFVILSVFALLLDCWWYWCYIADSHGALVPPARLRLGHASLASICQILLFHRLLISFHWICNSLLGRDFCSTHILYFPQVLWRRARWRNMSKQVNFWVTPGASVHHSLVTNTNTKYKWPEDDGDLKCVSILKTLTWIMRRDISRINSLWHSWPGLSQRYRRDTNTSINVHSTTKSMKEFRLHQHITQSRISRFSPDWQSESWFLIALYILCYCS